MKRNLKVVPVPSSTLVRVVWEGGGEVPDALKGQYTSSYAANMAILAWYSTKGAVEEEVALLKRDDERKRAAAK